MVGESLVKTMVDLNKIKKELRAEHIHKSIDQAMLDGKGKEKDKVTCRKGNNDSIKFSFQAKLISIIFNFNSFKGVLIVVNKWYL